MHFLDSRLRLYSSTSTYPAYDHTSYNIEWMGAKLTWHASVHVKHAWGDEGFHLGLRVEGDVERLRQAVVKLREEARQMQVQYTCDNCQRQEWGPPGMRMPEDWEFIHLLNICPDCAKLPLVELVR